MYFCIIVGKFNIMKIYNYWFIPLVVIALILILSSCSGTNNYESSLKNIEEKMYYYPPQAEKMLDSLLLQHSVVNEKKYKGELTFLKGFLEWHKGDIDSSMNLINSALITFIKQKNTIGQANCYLLMGWSSTNDNYFEQAKIYFYKTIKLLNNKPVAKVGIAYLDISFCKKQLKEPYKDDLNKGVKYLEQTGKVEFQLYAKYQKINDNIKNPGIIKQLNEIAEKYQSLELNNSASGVYKAMAIRYFYKQNPDSAFIYLDKAISVYDNKYPQASLIPSMHQIKGGVYLMQNDFKTARKEFMKSLNFYKTHKQLIRSYYVYNALSLLDKKEQNYKSSLKNLLLANKYKERLDIKEKQRMSKGLEISTYVFLLNEDILKSKKQNQLLLFLLLMFSVVGIIVFLLVTMKTRKKRYKIDVLKAKFQASIVSYQDKLKMIEFVKDKEVNQEEFIKQCSSGKKLKEIYPKLYSQVCIIFNNLSHSECNYALMFALYISEEDICEFNNIQQSSIRKVKQRIRKKLDLNIDKDLNKYFQKRLNL